MFYVYFFIHILLCNIIYYYVNVRRKYDKWDNFILYTMYLLYLYEIIMKIVPFLKQMNKVI